MHNATNRVYRVKARIVAPTREKRWLWWTLASSAGHIVGIGMAALILAIVQWAGLNWSINETVSYIVGLGVIGLLDGAMVGLAQSVVWRRYYPQMASNKWVFFTLIGGLGAWLLGPLATTVGFYVLSCFSLIPGPAFAGAIVGLAQAQVLKRYTGKVAFWVWINALAGVMGVFTGILAAPLWGAIRNIGVLYGGSEAVVVGIIAGLTVYSAITGWAFVSFVRSQEAVSR